MTEPTSDPQERSRSPEAATARGFVAVAVGSLVVAGVLSLMLLAGRVPPFDALVHDPLFFRRSLVVHVVLALVVWFYAFSAAMLATLPRRGESGRLSRVGPLVAAAGVLTMVASAWATGARPVLANYVPMIDHRLFEVGLVAFAAGVLLGVTDRRILGGSPSDGGFLGAPAAAVVGLRATGVALLLAALTFATSWSVAPRGLAADALFELANWGGGHVLQLASTCAMLSAWIVLLGAPLGRSPVSREYAAGVFGLAVLPWLAAPLLAARGIQDIAARTTFTRLMQFGLMPPILAIMAGCCVTLVRSRASLRDARVLGFAVSAALSLVGFALGALVRGSTTMVPAHYHASIGAVTAAFMTLCYPMLAALGHPLGSARGRRLAQLQPAVYGLGQLVFAVGFALAGAHGMARKVYGAEQQVRDAWATAGLVVMGAGGLAAVAGGVLFLALVVSALRRRHVVAADAGRNAVPWRLLWNQSVESIHSKS
jgi:cytochrome c oxidase subunit 1